MHYLKTICDALRNLVPFVPFKKSEKHPWRSATFKKSIGCYFAKSSTPTWVFFTFLNGANDIKSRKAAYLFLKMSLYDYALAFIFINFNMFYV